MFSSATSDIVVVIPCFFFVYGGGEERTTWDPGVDGVSASSEGSQSVSWRLGYLSTLGVPWYLDVVWL
jgi:hypothetical protein